MNEKMEAGGDAVILISPNTPWSENERPPTSPQPEGRVGGRKKKLDAAKRREIAESVISGRKTGAEMARSQPTVSRIVADYVG